MQQANKDLLLKTEQHLEKQSDLLIAELNKIIAGDWGLNNSTDMDKVELLDIEVFVDGYRLALYPMDRSGTQLGYKSLLEDAYEEGLLNSEELNPNFELYDFNNEDDNRELYEFEKAQQEIFFTWFTACWNKADKQQLKVPIYLQLHDTDESLHLQANKWVSEK